MLLKLPEWSNEMKESKIFKDRVARNLISQLLSKDPVKQPPLARVLNYPFLTGKGAVRMLGERAAYDVFLSRQLSATCCGETLACRSSWLATGRSWKEGF
jgi:hypothetical protein